MRADPDGDAEERGGDQRQQDRSRPYAGRGEVRAQHVGQLLQRAEQLKAERNAASAEIGRTKQGGGPTPERLRELVSGELAAVAEKFATPRRTVLLEGTGAARVAAGPLEVPDDPGPLLLSSAGLLARTAVAPPEPRVRWLPCEGTRQNDSGGPPQPQ